MSSASIVQRFNLFKSFKHFKRLEPLERLKRLRLRPTRILVIVFVKPLCDLPAGGAPDALVGADIFESLVQVFDAEGEANNKRMERDRHQIGRASCRERV